MHALAELHVQLHVLFGSVLVLLRCLCDWLCKCEQPLSGIGGVVCVGSQGLDAQGFVESMQCYGRGRNAVMSQSPLEFLVSLRACWPDGDVGSMSGLLSIPARCGCCGAMLCS